MAHALKFDTWPRPVISDHHDSQHVAEQADTYFGALVLASLLAMSGLQNEMGLRRVFNLLITLVCCV